jgi:uncharacterized protein (TIGR02466 family)
MSTPKLIDITPFEPLIIKTHYDGFDWKKLQPVCENLIKNTQIKSHLEQGEALSSAGYQEKQPHIMPEFADFYKWLDPIAQHIIKKEWCLYNKFKYIVSNSWVNVHGYGGETTVHHHGITVLTIAAYLQFPKNGGYIQFKDPLEYYKGFNMKNEDEEEYTWKTAEAEVGDVILFPGWIRHRTQKNMSKDNRWVLTTNYMAIPSAKW